jgi:hypothetical protein
MADEMRQILGGHSLRFHDDMPSDLTIRIISSTRSNAALAAPVFQVSAGGTVTSVGTLGKEAPQTAPQIG